MKIIIFAGGAGRRLWPISRRHSPKQFEAIIGDKSTVQLAVERLRGQYGLENLFISTNEQYLPILRHQLPEFPSANFISEPVRRDLAAAVGLAMAHMQHRFGADEVVAIVWGDNYMAEPAAFLRLLETAEQLVRSRTAKIVFMGETARFANHNLGWIGLGDKAGELNKESYYHFASWIYRPPLEECQRMFDSGQYVWNTGYFVTTAGFVLDAYRRFQPQMWPQLEQIAASIGEPQYDAVAQRLYPTLDVASFDDAIVQHIDPGQAVVLYGAMGWSDPGTLYALKESLNPDPEANVVKGLVKGYLTKDSLLYNYEEEKLMAVVGLEGVIVVNTSDAILVVRKEDIPLVKQLVDELDGTELEIFS